MATVQKLKVKDVVSYVRRNGAKIKATIIRAEYPGTKGSWVEIQPIDKKGENVGKTITCRPTQVVKAA